MRKVMFWCIALVCSACLQKATVSETFETGTTEEKAAVPPEEIKAILETGTPEEKWAFMLEHYIVPGAVISDERPLPYILSEKEVLLKAADYAISGLDEGSKIDTPVLEYSPNGEPVWYFINMVNNKGYRLLYVYVNPKSDTKGEPFAETRFRGGLSSKREAVEFTKSRFPYENVSEPVAVCELSLEDSRYSYSATFWYFTVEEDEQAGAVEEYIIPVNFAGGLFDIEPFLYAGQEPYGGSFHLKNHWIGRLDKPIHLFENIEALRATGGDAKLNYPTGAIPFTPIPIRKQ